MKYNIKSQEQYMAALQDIKDTLTAGHVIQYLKITYADDDFLAFTRTSGLHDHGIVYYKGQTAYCPLDRITNYTIMAKIHEASLIAGVTSIAVRYRKTSLLKRVNGAPIKVSSADCAFDLFEAGISGTLAVQVACRVSDDYPVTLYEIDGKLVTVVQDLIDNEQYVTVTNDALVADHILRHPYHARANHNADAALVRGHKPLLSISYLEVDKNERVVYWYNRAPMSQWGEKAHKLFSLNAF